MIRGLPLLCVLLVLACSQTPEKPMPIVMAKEATPPAKQVEPSHEYAAKERNRLRKSAIEIMQTVRDKESAGTAIVKFKALRKDALAYWAMTKKLGEPTEKEQSELNKRFGQETGDTLGLYFSTRDELEKPSERFAGDQCSPEIRTAVVAEADAFHFTVVRGGNAEGKLSWRWPANEETTARWKDIRIDAVFNTHSSGCEVVAVHVATGQELWRSHLLGIGPIIHFAYRNRVHIETDGKRVTIFGNEEQLDINTGYHPGNYVPHTIKAADFVIYSG